MFSAQEHYQLDPQNQNEKRMHQYMSNVKDIQCILIKKKRKKIRDQQQKCRQYFQSNQHNKANSSKLIQYRVKNEKIVIYNYYNPVRIIGSGAYDVVCEAVNTLTSKKCAIKKMKGVFDHVINARKILREFKLLTYMKHKDILSPIDVIECDA
eukprot:11536_1